MKNVIIIVALDESGGFGKDGKIPWNFPEDLKNFKQITKNNICIMGRRTYQDIFNMRKNKKNIKNILPNRTSLVLTSSTEKLQGAETFTSLREAVESLDVNDKRKIFILGGYRLFVEALSWTNKMHITLVPGEYDCDVHFPISAFKKFKIVHGVVNGSVKHIIYERFKQ